MHGIVIGDTKYTKVYDINSRDMKSQISKQIRRFKVEAHGAKPLTQKRDEAPRGGLKRKIQAEQNPKPRARRSKYIQIIPHETVPGNYLILEITLS